MIINVSYGQKRSFRKVKRESNKILGIKNLNADVLEYNGMIISYHKNSIQINTLLVENVNLEFLVQILNCVFRKGSVGISGISNNSALSGIKDVNIFWI